MPKKKSSSIAVPDSNNAATICIRNGIKVYPVNKKGKWYIEVDNNGKIKRFEKAISNDEINYSMSVTYIYYAEKLLKENGK